MVAAFSNDGINWSALKEFKTDSNHGPIGPIFKLARHVGKVYELSRTGRLWQSRIGIDYEPVKIIEPADGFVGENETASTFVDNKWLIFQRAGMVAEADPPYSHWTLRRERRAQLLSVDLCLITPGTYSFRSSAGVYFGTCLGSKDVACCRSDFSVAEILVVLPVIETKASTARNVCTSQY